jgi:hypothetical protein
LPRIFELHGDHVGGTASVTRGDRVERKVERIGRLAAGTVKTQWRSHRANSTQALIDAAL